MINNNKRGVVLIFSLFVATILAILIAAFYFQSVSENQLATRYSDSVRAFWLAEAGIAQVKANAGVAATSGYIDDVNNTYTVLTPTQIGSSNFYNVISTGRVVSYGGRSISRTVNATMQLVPPSSSGFQFCVETTSHDLEYKAKCVTNPENPANLVSEDSTKTFSGLFGIDKAQMKAISQSQGTYLSGSFGNTINASGVTWVDVTPGETLQIEHLNGSGIVVINGNFKVNGVPSDGFNGILYIIGQLQTLGNSAVYGTVFVESSASIGADLTGSSLITYNSTKISNALLYVATKSISSWREI